MDYVSSYISIIKTLEAQNDTC